ncbi:MAG: DUF1559 domain-containing protein, partial [Planctomycetota bacterium]
YACPSDSAAGRIRSPGRGRPRLAPTTYGFNFGTWFVYDPQTNRGGDGMFYPNSFLRFRDCLDGTSTTLMAAEVRAWTPYRRNGGPTTTTAPENILQAETVIASGGQFKNTGHTEWPDGRVHHTGFTTVMPPGTNTTVSDGTREYDDGDFNSWQEGKNGVLGNPSFAIITSRSYHNGLVHATMVDGSVRSYTDSTDQNLWRSLGTRHGSEIVTLD